MNNLRIDIDGKWTADQFALFMHSVNSLYHIGLLRPDENEIPTPFFCEIVSQSLLVDSYWGRRWNSPLGSAYYPLEVESVKFASPGRISLFGDGKAVKYVTDLIRDLLFRKAAARRLEAEASVVEHKAELERQRVLEARIANADKILKMRKRMREDGIAEEHAHTLLLSVQRPIADGILDGRITNVEVGSLAGRTPSEARQSDTAYASSAYASAPAVAAAPAPSVPPATRGSPSGA